MSIVSSQEHPSPRNLKEKIFWNLLPFVVSLSFLFDFKRKLQENRMNSEKEDEKQNLKILLKSAENED